MVNGTIAAVAAGAQRTLEAAGYSLEDARRDVSVLARSLLGWDQVSKERSPCNGRLNHAGEIPANFNRPFHELICAVPRDKSLGLLSTAR